MVGLGPLHPVRRIVGDRVVLAQRIEQRGQRGELATDGRRRQGARFQVLAPGDQVGAGDGAKVLRANDPDEGGEVPHVLRVGAAGSGVGEVGEPLQGGRHGGQAPEFGGGQGAARRDGRGGGGNEFD